MFGHIIWATKVYIISATRVYTVSAIRVYTVSATRVYTVSATREYTVSATREYTVSCYSQSLMLLSKSHATLKVPCYSQSPMLLSKSHATMSKSLAELASLAVAWGRGGIWGTSWRHLEASVAAPLAAGSGGGQLRGGSGTAPAQLRRD